MARTDTVDEARRESLALRGEFVRSFVEHGGPRPASEVLMVRLPALLSVSAFVAVGALVIGIFWEMISPADAAAPGGAQSSIRYTAVAGWDCKGATDHGFEAHGRTAAWSTVPSGGWGGDGCPATFEAIPMSGRPAVDDPGQFAVFWFVPTARLCAVAVFVPDGPEADTAATAAHYAVLDGRDGATFAEFVVDQSTHRGGWVPVGSFPLKGKEIALKVTNRGAPVTPTDRLAVAQIRLECSD